MQGGNPSEEQGDKAEATPTKKAGKGPGLNKKGKGPIKAKRKSPRKTGEIKSTAYKDATRRLLSEFGIDVPSGSDEEQVLTAQCMQLAQQKASGALEVRDRESDDPQPQYLKGTVGKYSSFLEGGNICHVRQKAMGYY